MCELEKKEFVEWHEKRMEELQYPPALREQLRMLRIKFIKY